MGMFDTIHFEKPYSCPLCGAEIWEMQTKELGYPGLAHGYVKGTISHEEDFRIVKDELRCDACRKYEGRFVYVVIVRGIVVGVADSLPEAQNMLSSLDMEKLVTWYHDLYGRYAHECRRQRLTISYMKSVVDWFENRKAEESQSPFYIAEKERFRDVKDPLDALKRYLSENEKDKEPGEETH